MLNENNPDGRDIELVSKTQRKRDSHDLQKFGKALVALKPAQLAALDLPDGLLYALFEAQNMLDKRRALKRQYQFIGKILRGVDLDPIFARYGRIANKTNSNNKIQQQAEFWRDQIVLNGNNSISELMDTLTVACDRQQLRQLARHAQSAKKDAQKITYAKHIFKVLFAVLKQQEKEDDL